MAKNNNLHAAKVAKNDEFYTQFDDIQRELNHYTKHFEGKTVLCNCDDPFESNFCKFFLLNFNYLKLKRLICTSYSGSKVLGTNKQMSLFDEDNEPVVQEHGYVLDVKSVPFKGGDITEDDIDALLNRKRGGVRKLKGNGSFDSPECIELLKQADIVVTNPMFSLFRPYIALLMEYNKQFLVIGNKNAVTYKEIFPLLKDNKIWLGCSIPQEFILPDGTVTKKVAGLCRWFTNLDHNKRHEKLILFRRYYDENGEKSKEAKEMYLPYDNYDAINVDKVGDIPCDYAGVMGVPITFLDKFNPEQFDILELGNSRDNFTPSKDYINPKKHLKDGTVCNGGAINCVLAIEQDAKPTKVVYYTSDNSKYLIPPYARILIRNKHPQPPLGRKKEKG